MISMAANLTSSDTTAKFGLGDELSDNGTVYKYLLAGEALTIYDMCVFNESFTAVQSDTDDAGFATAPKGFAVPQFAVASAEYFWAPIGPIAKYRPDGTTLFYCNSLASNVLSVVQYATATAGAIDDAGTVKIQGLNLSATVGGAAAPAAITAFTRLFTSL